MRCQLRKLLPLLSFRTAHTKSDTKFPSEQIPATDYNAALKEAQQVVGYPTSFLNLRWVLSDEIANIASHLYKLLGTNHPLLQTARDFFFKNDAASWGLIILLVSKATAAGIVDEREIDKTAGILHSQRILAEVTEMIKTGFLIHDAIMNIDKKSEFYGELHYGNKVALLSGDYLLSKSNLELSHLRNQTINMIVSTAIRDFSEYEFLGVRNSEDIAIPSEPKIMDKPSLISDENNVDFGPYDISRILGVPKDEWILRSLLRGTNLLAKCCNAAVILSKREKRVENQAYLFGKHLGLAWQARNDLVEFTAGKRFNLISAPVMLYLHKSPGFYNSVIKCKTEADFERFREIIVSSTTDDTNEMIEMYKARALNNLMNFEDNDARSALGNIVSMI